jgi:hypothetical protein
VTSAIVFAVVLSVGLWSCGRGTTAPSAPTAPSTSAVAAPTVTAIGITGTSPAIGSTAQFSATTTLSNGATQSVTSQATWQSSAVAVATVTSTGSVTGVGTGESHITAVYQSVTGRMHIALVRAPSLTFSISGVVTDGFNGGLLNGASVSGGGKSATTDANGRYAFAGISSGSVTVTAARSGFVTGTRTVSLMADTQINLPLDRMPTATPPPPVLPVPTAQCPNPPYVFDSNPAVNRCRASNG